MNSLLHIGTKCGQRGKGGGRPTICKFCGRHLRTVPYTVYANETCIPLRFENELGQKTEWIEIHCEMMTMQIQARIVL